VGLILSQLGINETYFIQLGFFVVLFFILNKIYFQPFFAFF